MGFGSTGARDFLLRRKGMEYSRAALMEAKRQIDSTLHKLRETVKTLEGREPGRCKPQITLAKRRIQAFTIAAALIVRELERSGKKSSRVTFSLAGILCPLCTVAGCLWEAPRFACRGADLLRRELALLGFFLSGGSPCSIVC